MNNKTLFIVLIALVGVFILSKVTKGDKSRSFDPLVVEVDTASVDKIEIVRKAQPGTVVTITREPSGWSVSDGNVIAPAPASNVASTLAAVSRIEAQRIVARSKEKWPDYEVGEEANHISVFVKGDRVAELIIGGFKFDQARRSASTYIRRAGETDVYLVEGFLAMQLTQGMDTYRDNTILKTEPTDVTRIEYSVGQDVHVFSRQTGEEWYYAGMEAIDSAAMAGYLNGLRNVSSRDFVNALPAGGSEKASLRISGNNMNPAEITLFELASDSTTSFVLRSTLNQGAYFASDSSGVYEKVFGNLEELLLQL